MTSTVLQSAARRRWFGDTDGLTAWSQVQLCWAELGESPLCMQEALGHALFLKSSSGQGFPSRLLQLPGVNTCSITLQPLLNLVTGLPHPSRPRSKQVHTAAKVGLPGFQHSLPRPLSGHNQ